MKKLTLTTLVILAALACLAFDMADYGTTRSITNLAASATMGDVLITYDSTATNTITFDVILADGVTYRLGSSSVTGATYDSARDLIPIALTTDEVWLITTTDTNVNINVSGI